MTQSRDPERLIHAFLLEGGERLHDQVYDAVRADIEKKRQRAVFGPWRAPIMNKLVPIGLGAAAVVGVLFVGSQLLGPPPGPGGPGVSPTPSPEPSVAEPSPSSTPESLPLGSHLLQNEALGVPMTVTIPAAGWFGEPGGGILATKDDVDAPDGAGLIVFAGLGDLYVYGDPCRWSTTTPETPSTTVDELVAALTAQASRDASPPVDVTIDGYAGKSITLHVPDDADFSQCDQGYFGSWGFDQTSAPSRYHQDPGQIDELWIVDVDGVLVVIDANHYAGTPAEDIDELRAIVASIKFELP